MIRKSIFFRFVEKPQAINIITNRPMKLMALSMILFPDQKDRLIPRLKVSGQEILKCPRVILSGRE